MEETSEGLANSAATREAAKRKRGEAETFDASSAKKPARPVPVLKHEVAAPPGFQESDRNLDQALHGESPSASAHVLGALTSLFFN